MDRNWTDRLSEYLDGELGRGESAALETRLAEDADLRKMLEQLRAVRRAAAAVPDHRAPADELWPGIEARIERVGGTAATRSDEGGRRRRTLMFTLPQLAAAAGIVLLLGVSVGRLTEGPGASTPAVTTQVATQSAAPAATRASYAGFVADLEQRLDVGRDVLQPETARVIEQSLAKIDTAIAQARTALENDPNNAYLNQHLASAQARKLRLLEDATALIASRT
jgi:anti-sigma factor RsiW